MMKNFLVCENSFFCKILTALIICAVFPFSFLRADVPDSSGTEIFHGYDVYSTTIIKEGKEWKQWFGGWMSESDLPWDRIYYTESNDSGLSWNQPQLAFTIPNVQVNDPSVIRLWDPDSSAYYYLMYYTYYPSGLGDPTNYVATSISWDGIHWMHNGTLIGKDNGLDMDGAWSPSAVSEDSLGNTVYLYFHNNHPNQGVFRTTLHNHGLGFDKTSTIAVTEAGKLRANVDVSRNNGKWWMFYNGSSLTSDNKGNFNTCKMYSDDGIHWMDSGLNPIQQWDTMTTCTPYVNWTGDSTYQLWYGFGTPSFMDFSVYMQSFKIRPEPFLPVVASSEVLSVMNAIKAIDNDPATFWSSNGHVSTGYFTEWIYRDFGETEDIAQVILTPRVADHAVMCFPLNFKIQGSDDGVQWTDIPGQSYTNYTCEDTLAQKFAFAAIASVRYIRIIATRLSADSYGNFYFQISEFGTSGLLTSDGNNVEAEKPSISQLQNYPNPFCASTTISYTLQAKSAVRIKIYDMHGKEVAILTDAVQTAGPHQVEWNGKNLEGEQVDNGYYLCTLTSEGQILTRKLLIIK
jgi:hypothetical protein